MSSGMPSILHDASPAATPEVPALVDHRIPVTATLSHAVPYMLKDGRGGRDRRGCRTRDGDSRRGAVAHYRIPAYDDAQAGLGAVLPGGIEPIWLSPCTSGTWADQSVVPEATPLPPRAFVQRTWVTPPPPDALPRKVATAAETALDSKPICSGRGGRWPGVAAPGAGSGAAYNCWMDAVSVVESVSTRR